MKTLTSLSWARKSAYSAFVFFGTLVVLSAGYAAWNGAMGQVTTGSPLSANGWNALVDNIADLNSRWGRVGGNIAFTWGYVGIGTPNPAQLLDVNGLAIFRNQTAILAGSNSSNASLIVNNAANTVSYVYVRGDGNIGIGTTSPTNLLSVGSAANLGQTSSFINVRSAWNSLEWGHSNQAGYASTLGADSGAGRPFICLSCEAGTTSNTYRTRGLKGSVISTDNAGALRFESVAGANADNQTSTANLTVFPGGNATLAGTLTQSSDERLKKDIAPIENSLEKISRLNGVNYHWKDSTHDSKLQMGVIAQEVEKVFPEAVMTDSKGMKSVAYGNLVAPLIEAIKELSHKIDGLFVKYIDQQKEIESLKARLDALERK